MTLRPGEVFNPRSSRLKAWANAADAGETQWAAKRGPGAKVACWALVALLVIGALLGRANLNQDPLTSLLLTAANAVALMLALASLRHARFPPVMYSAILGVFLFGGIFQIYLLSYNFPKNPNFIHEQLPFHGWVGSSDISQVYGLVTLAFVIYCLLVAVLTAIPLRTSISRTSTLMNFGRLKSLLLWASIAYCGFTALQLTLGIGQAALYNRQLPFRLVAITLFYQRELFPALLLLGVWVYDRHRPKLSYLCVIGTGVMVVSLSYGATSRGSLVRFGLPLLFLWLFTGRFTKLRKSLVLLGFALYLISAPILSTLRVARVHAAIGSFPGIEAPAPLSAESLNYELGHFVFRVGGAGSLMFAMHAQDDLSLSGMQRVFRPSGLTGYFTYQVMGQPQNATVVYSQAPTALGLGVLVGGVKGMALVLVLMILGFDLAARWIAKTLRTWPVALAILASNAAGFFSEGTPILVYKSLLAVALVELSFRFVAGHGSRTVPRQGRGLALDARAHPRVSEATRIPAGRAEPPTA